MFGSRTTIAAIAALTLGALGVAAETAEEYRVRFLACTNTLSVVDPGPVYYFEYDDPGFINFTYRYNPEYCDSTILINTIKLQDNIDANLKSYTCNVQQFAPDRSTIFSECQSNTRGSLAIAARDTGHDDYAVLLNVGQRSKGQVVQTTDYFMIGPPPEPETPAPTPSGSFQKRRSVESQHKFDCPIGHTYCWTGERQEYACMDTSSDVTACGRCPYAPGKDDFGGDCTSIEGADDVQCLQSKCVVNACERGFQVSLDRTKCLDGSKRSIMSRGILF